MGRLLAPLTSVTVVVAALLASCSTEDAVKFGEPDCVGGVCGANAGVTSSSTTTTSTSTSSSSSSGMCTQDPNCAVSFATDIFAPIIDGPAGCTGAACHATGAANAKLTLDPKAIKAGRKHLLDYVLDAMPGPAGQYIVPCDPAGSRLVCNLKVEPDADGGAPDSCGSLMPVGAMYPALTADQVGKIKAWIACGAPDN
jgi:hypothetical protein